ncbi:MAG: Transcriptional regulator [Thermoleophilia bacterium]|jgi:DNA-binding MarR family transcriptional regulator|nr:Transcriptional regulator [Thermoleophilia bacterium]
MTNETLSRGGPSTVGSLSAPIEATSNMAISLSGLLAQWLRGLTINAHERLALAHLWEHGSMTMSELGARIPLSRAAVTALTDRLEALGYVLRTPDEHDRRRTVLSLTPRPAALIDTFVAGWNAEVSAFEAGLTPEELRAVVRWSEGIREISHRHATKLRARRDDELPVAQEVNRR